MKGYSEVLFRQITKLEKREVSNYAHTVMKQRKATQERLLAAQRALAQAETQEKKERKALKKYRKTDNVKFLKIFGV